MGCFDPKQILLKGRGRPDDSQGLLITSFVGGFSPTPLKNMQVKMDHFPKLGMKIKKIFELPPPSWLFKVPGWWNFMVYEI